MEDIVNTEQPSVFKIAPKARDPSNSRTKKVNLLEKLYASQGRPSTSS